MYQNSGSVPRNNNDGEFQAWVGLIVGQITQSGFLYVPTTNDMTVSAVLAPTAATQKRGHRLWSFNDSLQATAPVFFRIDFGSGGSTANPSIWVTVGSNHMDGIITSASLAYPNSGSGVGVSGSNTSSAAASFEWSNHQLACNGSQAATASMSIAGDGSKGWLVLPMWWDAANVNQLLTLERTRDVTGSIDGRGVLAVMASNAGTARRIYTTIFTSASVEAFGRETVLHGPNTFHNPTAYSSSLGGGEIVTVNGIPHLGLNGPEEGLNAIVYSNFDTGSGATLTPDPTGTFEFITIRGQQHVYRLFGTAAVVLQSTFLDTPTAGFRGFGLRWEK